MCTVSWKIDRDGYELFFNRDESLTRLEAMPPQLTVKRGVSVLSPVDADSGGTWLSINDRGISCFLLNHYPKPAGNFSMTRGAIVREMMYCTHVHEFDDLLRALDLRSCAPFRFGVVAPGMNPRTWSWNCKELLFEGDSPTFLSSSGFKPESVVPTRLQTMAGATLKTTADFMALHRSHAPEKSAYSICMHRHDAKTVSFSRIAVRSELAEFHYTPGSPCEAAESHVTQLRLRSKLETPHDARVA